MNIAFAGGKEENDGYTLSLKELINQAQENIDKVDAQLEKKKIDRENEERESLARAHFQKGNTLYKQGKLKEAREEWQKALDLTSHPDMKEYIRQSDRKARQEINEQKQQLVADETEVNRGYDLMTTVQPETKETKEAAPAAKKEKPKKTTPVKKNKVNKKAKTAVEPKTETPKVKRGCVFEGSALMVNDVKETQDKPKTVSKQKKSKQPSEDKTSKRKWWQFKKSAASKEEKPKKETKEEAAQQGYVVEGSSLMINDVKETKKDTKQKTPKNKIKPKAKLAPPVAQIEKNKPAQEEKITPQKGYDIYVK